MMCISFVSYKIKVNEKLIDVIEPTRGLRQGDPMSSYLFLLVAEWLSSALAEAQSSEKIKGINISRQAPQVNHLLFADDCLIFLRANMEEVRALKQIMEDYKRLSEQTVNYAKSEIMFSSNVDDVFKRDVCVELGMMEVEKHTKYLGLPVIVGQNKKMVFRELEDKVAKKFQG